MIAMLLAAVLAGAPASGAPDERAVQLALRALKMSEHDLSFSKTNVESELVLPEVRQLLQQPLLLPARATATVEKLHAVSSLTGLVESKHEILRAAQYDNSSVLVAGVPPAVVQAVEIIYEAAKPFRLTETTLSTNDYRATLRAPLDAFALDTFRDDRATFGIDVDLLRRDEALLLQDDELANTILAGSDSFDRDALQTAFATLAGAVDAAVAGLRTNTFAGEFQIETNTPVGRILLGGVGRNVYTNEAFLIIDTGGDDVYENRAGGANGLDGRPVSIVIDLSGNDRYSTQRFGAQGAGIFGIGILVDAAGDDLYEAKHLSQGAGFFGCGLLADYGGHDKFVADTFAQGAGGFGAGILWQRGGDTSYRASQLAQGFGGTHGAGLLLDAGGHDAYVAGGKNPCGWLAGHFFSLSQGFGCGMRPFAGGGSGILCDLAGDDRYTADVYGQGASYWYSIGLLLDAAGNDTYDAFQYCQGAGVHLSNGALVDWAGNDTYKAGHICQGAAHDYSVGMLIDRAGNDSYTGDTTAQGTAINNSFAMLLDHAGNDTYTGTDPKQSQAAGHDGDKREYGSIALLLDLAGKDSYSQGQTNNAMWLKPLYGAGLDMEWKNGRVEAWKPVGATFLSRPESSTNRLYVVPPVDPHHPIEHLLRLAISDRPDAGKAWEELRNLGTNALAHLVTRLDSPNVLVRAKTEDLVDALNTNSIPVLISGIQNARNDEIARLCCYLLARFDEKADDAIPAVLPLLDRDKTITTAFYTLGHLRARQAFEPALKNTTHSRELVRLRAAQVLGKLGEREAALATRAIPALLTAFGDEMWDVRYAAQDALVAFGKPAIAPLRRAYAKAPSRARPHIIEALAKLGDKRALALAKSEYRQDDPLVRNVILKSLQDLPVAK